MSLLVSITRLSVKGGKVSDFMLITDVILTYRFIFTVLTWCPETSNENALVCLRSHKQLPVLHSIARGLQTSKDQITHIEALVLVLN